jgi:tRNA dimethylallyltransferase
LCEHYPFEIISVDSALVYRGMNIGTAKPTAAEQARVAHHLIDIRDPSDAYSAADFRADALRLMTQISARGNIPLLVGGTMLYFKVLREGIAALPAADATVRAELAERAQREGWPSLHRELQQVDPVAAARIHPNHSQRIQRALEVYRLTGEPMSQLQQRAEHAGLMHRLLNLAIAPADRAVLHERIAMRFQQMLAQGLIEEVEQLRRRGDLNPDLPSIRAVGYRQVWSYLDGETDYAGMVEQGIAATRQLAKRQFTWLRQLPDCRWIITDAGQRVVASEQVELPEGVSIGAEVDQLALKYVQQSSI